MNILKSALAAAVFALAACGNASTTPDSPADAAVECYVYLTMQEQALARGGNADVTEFEMARVAWRAEAAKTLTPDELNQYVASTVAVLDDSPPVQVAREAQRCVSSAPAH